MNTLIAYTSKYGCASKCAAALAKKLTGKVELCDLKTEKPGDLSNYDKVVIGGSIYIGMIQKEVKNFCAANLTELQKKKLGFFICAMRDGEELNTEINTAFPKELLDKAIAKESFGGEFILSKMNFMDRLIAKKVAKVDKDSSKILEDNIDKLAQLMNNA